MSIRTKRNSRRFIAAAAAVAVAASTFAVSNSPVSAVTPASPSTNRIAGADRYETAAEIARAYTTTVGSNGLVVSSGESPYDALAASTLAGLIDAPLVLVRKDSVPTSVVELLEDSIANFNSSAQKVYIVGGTSAISQEVEDAIKAIVHTGKLTAATRVGIVRIAGTDRYDTAKKITEVAGLTLATDRMILVNGDNDRWADALSVSNIAAKNKWPIVTTSNGGLNATAKAAIDAYLAKPGSAKKFLIVGGPAVMPTSIETYLDSKAVPLANIDRRGGADRYQTNLLLNLYALTSGLNGENNVPTFVGASVAIATGLSPWDALAAGPYAAKNNTHIVLTQPSALNPNVVGLAGALTAAGLPTNLLMIGGTAAVPNAIRSAFIATSQSSNMSAPTLTGCVPGSTQVTVTFPKAVSEPLGEVALFEAGTPKSFLTRNAVADTTVRFTASVAAGTLATSFVRNPLNTNPVGDNLFTQFLINLAAPLAPTNVIGFSGIPEAGGFKRSFAAASCTVAADTTAPTATIKPVLNANGSVNHILVTMSERGAPSVHGLLGATSKATYGGGVSWSAGTTLTVTTLSAGVYRVVPTGATATTVVTTSAAAAVVTLSASAIVDLAGNTAAADISGSAARDTTAPTITLAGVTCVATTPATFATQGITAKTAVEGGSVLGVAGNAWRLSVVNQRGLVLPSVVVDNTAQTITVTLDTTYHTAADIKTVAANAGQTANWAFSGTGTFAATVTPAAPTAGTSTCNATVLLSEPGVVSSPSVVVDGVAITSPSPTVPGTVTGLAGAAVVNFVTARAGVVSLTAAVEDLGGTSLSRTVTGTIS